MNTLDTIANSLQVYPVPQAIRPGEHKYNQQLRPAEIQQIGGHYEHLQQQMDKLHEQLTDLNHGQLSINEFNDKLDEAIQHAQTLLGQSEDLNEEVTQNGADLNPRTANFMLFSLKVAMAEIDVNNEASLITSHSVDKMQTTMDQLSNLATFLAYIGKFLKGLLAEINNDNSKDNPNYIPKPSITWDDLNQYDFDKLSKLAKHAGFSIGRFSAGGKYVVGIVSESKNVPDILQNYFSKSGTNLIITPAAIDNCIKYISTNLALVLPDKSTSPNGSLYDDYHAAALDSALCDSVNSTITSRIKAINDKTATIPNRVAILQTATQTLIKNFESLVNMLSQFFPKYS